MIAATSGVLETGNAARSVPALVVQAGGDAQKRFIEFFAAQIRNRNTREAYIRAVVERAIQALRATGTDIDEALLPHLSPLGWEHINLTGDYIWRQHKLVEQGKYRSLRTPDEP